MFRARRHEIDLLIIDMVMPGMDGRTCFRAIQDMDPGVKAILSSGYGRNGRAQEVLDDGMLGFIQKPYRLDELGAAVHSALSTT